MMIIAVGSVSLFNQTESTFPGYVIPKPSL